MKYTNDLVLFWGWKDEFSNFFPAKIRMMNYEFATSEHVFMYIKATYFNDTEAMNKISSLKNPAKAKEIGRRIKFFDEDEWVDYRETAMYLANYEKYRQNPELLKLLLDTGNRILAEASPIDCIWGIGYSVDDEEAYAPNKWRGINLLGNILMELREDFRKEGVI